MIWGETTSIMGTHDTETENYFKGGELVRLQNARKDLFHHNIIHSHSKMPIIFDLLALSSSWRRTM